MEVILAWALIFAQHSGPRTKVDCRLNFLKRSDRALLREEKWNWPCFQALVLTAAEEVLFGIGIGMLPLLLVMMVLQVGEAARTNSSGPVANEPFFLVFRSALARFQAPS